MILTQNVPEIDFDTIDAAIAAIKAGKVVIVVDDADRENEGDFICAAECITPEIVNFMASFGRGLICCPIDEKRADELNLRMMVQENTALHETAFTVSIDLLGRGCSTGISAKDRALTIKALTDADITGRDFARPGHIFPLRAKTGGVLRRTGHTEAAIDLAVLAGYQPVGTLVEILNEDGSMARVPDLKKIAEKYDLKMITIKDLIAYRLKHERIVELLSTRDVQTDYGDFKLHLFKQTTTGDVHIALTKGAWQEEDDVLLRVHSTEHPSDLFGILFEQLDHSIRGSLKLIEEAGNGALIYMHHMDKELSIENRIDDLFNDNQYAPSKAQRDFGVGAQIIRDLGIKNINLITNQLVKRVGLDGYGLSIHKTTPLER
ncbi:UNVERIFIED_CONTAM: hypothetical protein GTU68_028918 [Idotea baltica]|nr:hypothetical protein [Idotea baltica]